VPDVFQPMVPADRAVYERRYVAWLHETDGLPDLQARTLPSREARFRELESRPKPPALVDQAVYDRNVRRSRPEPGLDRRTLWALAVAKANRAERYGIELKLWLKGFEPRGADDPYTFVELQELYHTRIFVALLRTVGIDGEILPPKGLTRLVVTLAGGLPHAISDVVALAAELSGVAAFRLLLETARELFADEPVVLAEIEDLFRQILVEEVGHVRFLRSRLGPLRLRIAAALLPLVTRGMIDDMPELVALLGRDRYLAEVMRCDVTGAVADYEGRMPLLEG
jgi:hypothetical protein